MLRRFSRLLAGALFLAGGCEDANMDLLPQPAAKAGTGGASAAGMAGSIPGGDSGHGGTLSNGGAGALGGSGSSAGTGGCGGNGCPCPPGTPAGTICCGTNDDCPSALEIPICSYNRCVQCLGPRDCQAEHCGCEADELCVEDYVPYCVPRCATNDDCKDDDRRICAPGGMCIECIDDDNCENGRQQHCHKGLGKCVECTETRDCSEGTVCSGSSDRFPNSCVQCTKDKDCEGNSAGEHCNLSVARCVECNAWYDCTDPEAPICELAGSRCRPCNGSSECGTFGPCTEGRCVNRPAQGQLPPEPGPEPQPEP